MGVMPLNHQPPLIGSESGFTAVRNPSASSQTGGTLMCGHWSQNASRRLKHPIAPWLISNGSLTQRLTAYSGGYFAVMPIREYFGRPSRDETGFLGVPVQQFAWIREVYLFGHPLRSDQPPEAQAWVMARSVIPLKTLRGKGRRLRYLGRRSLGSVLFAQKKLSCQRQYRCMEEGVYSRRSHYRWHQQSVLVQETFLPAFVNTLIG